MKYIHWSIILLVVVLVTLFASNLYFGAVHIPASAVTDILLGGKGERPSWSFILWENRLPQAVTAVLSGAGLPHQV